ncbi:PKD domain-containing protein [Blastococcus sp. KM273128]|uniref:PKD domain-containing protein n=1 Tax=Blastococcus sp. KM273128 TaxID=2570314 RepID=UPI001F20685B|nr:PKD domain-containing protein [Blastococcus sp. KM273128]
MRLLCGLVVTAVLVALVGVTGTASAVGTAQRGVVAAVPGDSTPAVLDNKVLDIAEVGDRIVVVGSFTAVRDSSTNGGAEFAQPYVFAFDPATGAIDRAFAPKTNGQVNAVAAGPDGTVYLGGTFNSLNGAASRNLVQVSLATGERTGFRAGNINGAVNDLALAGGRLYVAGVFSTVGGVPHNGLATVHPTTGALDEYMGIDVFENHNWPRGTARASVGVSKIDISPDGSRLVAIGNFRIADGQPRDQAMVVRLDAAQATVDADWRTRRFEPACYSGAFDSYVRDVEFAPDGSYFVIVTTGAHFTGTLCDTATRWETGATGQDVQPRWIADTGGDTLFSVAVSGSAVYVGGHQRWMNNPTGNDAARPGAVGRPGIAALDPRTGVPLSWNPGRNPRGVGAEALTLTSRGLYVGMDTEYIGNRQYLRPRLAFFPLDGGTTPAAEELGQLPANVVLAGRTSTGGRVDANDVRVRYFTGAATPSADGSVDKGGTDWSRARGAFMVDGTLFYGYPTASGSYALHKRTFDGVTFGEATVVDPYNDPFWSTISAGTRDGVTSYYRGMAPSFYGSQLSSVTGMFYADGRLYYTRSGSATLYYRYFSPESGIVSEDTFVAAGSGFYYAAGMFLSGGRLHYANSLNGELRSVAFVNGAPSGSSTVAAAGPLSGGRDWRTRAMFLGPQPNVAPTASFTADCLGLVCSLDGAASTDGDGSVASYSWNFGNGTTATGPMASTTYATAGSYPVTLTVTDDDGASASTTQTVTVAPVATGEGIALRDTAGVSARVVTSASLTVPASVQAGDALLLALTTNSTATGQAPAGYELVGTQTSGTAMTTQVFSRVATEADAGATVTVDLSRQAKVTLQLAAYSGTDWRAPVAAFTGAADVGGTAHTTPTAAVEAGSWVVSVWADRSSSARTFTAPSATAERSNLAGVGNGDIASLVADGGAPVPAGQVGGLTATVPVASGRATMLTVVLAPGDGTLPPANVAPTAAIESTCASLTCTFDATGSTDADGTVTGFAWDFGDGQVATTATAEHTFATAGEHEVTLTVTDDDGATSVATSTVTVAAPPPPSGIGLRGSAGSADRVVTSATLEVPASVRAGDGLLLVLSTNSTVTGAAPAGWTEVGRVSANDLNPTTQVFSRVAAAGDAGTTVTVALSGQAKVTAQLMAYSGTAATPVASFTAATGGAGTAHTTPVATAAEGNWVLSVWSDKQGDERQWTPPTAGVTERSNIAGIGSGDIATLVADSGGPVAAGPVGGLTATVPTPSNRATMITVVLVPEGGVVAPPANEAPTAAIESTCASLTCTFDATGSTDADGTVTGFAWDLGDGQVATTATAEHTYAAAGEYEVTLTVTDDGGATAVATSTVTVAAPPPPVTAGIGLRGSAGSSDRVVTSAALEVPASVQAGDGMVLVLSTNSTVTGAAPAGWVEVGRVSANDQNPTTQVFSRVAGAGDAGTAVSVALSGQAKVTLQLMAYSGTSAAGPVGSFTAATAGAGTAHTTPVATAAEGNWVLSVWSDKQGDERQWTPPTAGVTERSNIAGVGSGDIATLLADSGGPVAAGPVGGLTATVPTPSNRATMITLVLAQA